ncbi:hypothetical protein K3495_g7816 [Podosphaera aphanis]|nr:hypothetical protein K3495_g7816 [Podosphaera aphanis]
MTRNPDKVFTAEKPKAADCGYKYIDTLGEIDIHEPQDLTREKVNGFILWFIRTRTQREYRDEQLWHSFREAFEGWKEHTFQVSSNLAREDLQTYLRANGVHVIIKTGARMHSELARLVQDDEQRPWTDDDVQIQLERYRVFNSRLYPRKGSPRAKDAMQTKPTTKSKCRSRIIDRKLTTAQDCLVRTAHADPARRRAQYTPSFGYPNEPTSSKICQSIPLHTQGYRAPDREEYNDWPGEWQGNKLSYLEIEDRADDSQSDTEQKTPLYYDDVDDDKACFDHYEEFNFDHDEDDALDYDEEDALDHDEEAPSEHDEEDALDHDEEAPSEHDEKDALDHDEEAPSEHDEEDALDHDEEAPSENDEEALSDHEKEVPSDHDEEDALSYDEEVPVNQMENNHDDFYDDEEGDQGYVDSVNYFYDDDTGYCDGYNVEYHDDGYSDDYSY